MQAIGFYRQLRHGLAHGPDLQEAIVDPLGLEDRQLLTPYLRGCTSFAATGYVADDVLDPARKAVSNINTRTDGQYFWPEDLAYYVEVYGARPPAEFIEHVRRAKGIPRLNSDDLKRIRPLILAAAEEQK